MLTVPVTTSGYHYACENKTAGSSYSSSVALMFSLVPLLLLLLLSNLPPPWSNNKTKTLGSTPYQGKQWTPKLNSMDELNRFQNWKFFEESVLIPVCFSFLWTHEAAFYQINGPLRSILSTLIGSGSHYLLPGNFKWRYQKWDLEPFGCKADIEPKSHHLNQTYKSLFLMHIVEVRP